MIQDKPCTRLPCQIAAATPPENMEGLVRHLMSHAGPCPLVVGALEPLPVLGPPSPPQRDVLAAHVVAQVEALLSHEDIYRRPPRVAAPRLLERLASVGLTIQMEGQ